MIVFVYEIVTSEGGRVSPLEGRSGVAYLLSVIKYCYIELS